jgi:hypothetical protein
VSSTASVIAVASVASSMDEKVIEGQVVIGRVSSLSHALLVRTMASCSQLYCQGIRKKQIV